MSRVKWFLILIVLITGSLIAGDWWSVVPPETEPQYVGRQSCIECHQQEHKNWTGSDHDLAMDLATPETVLGNFDHVEFEHLGVKTLFEREGDKFFATTEGPTGKPEKFAIKYVFGVRPLQQYMVEFPDGRVQVLSVCWDTKKQEWFDLHPHERMAPDDWLHWTQGGSNWNYMCAECHSTNVHKNFDLAKNTYHTTFSEIDVSCEACHGPGSIHVDLAQAKSLFWDRHWGYGLAQLKSSNVAELEACAKCHSHRRVVCGGHQAQRHFNDHYEQQLISTGLYHVDGQILEEVYELGSYHQSRMFREGVKCTNCHDPHSTRVKFEGNKLCLQCHTLSKGNYDSPAHHHHKPEGAGALCVECHMPTRNYMVVDARRDHSIRVPRPDLTVKLGVPNACQNCHNKPHETAGWATAIVAEWFPNRKHEPHYGEVFAQARGGELSAMADLFKLTQRKGNRDQAKNVGPIVRASAASLLVNYPLSETRRELEKLLKDEDAVVRVTAARTIAAQTPRSESDATRLREALSPLLTDPSRLVRTEVARLLTVVPQDLFSTSDKLRFERAFAEWEEGLQEVIDDAGTHIELALAFENLGNRQRAQEEYQTALRLRPNEMQALQARMNLAMLAHFEKRDDETERLYAECIVLASGTLRKLEGEHKAQPDNPTTLAAIEEQRRRLSGVLFNMGLLLTDKPDRENDAFEALRKAGEVDPSNARIQFNFGLLAVQLGKLADGETALKKACELDGQMLDARQALTELLRKQKRWPEAIASAEKLVQFGEQYRGLLEQIQREAKGE